MGMRSEVKRSEQNPDTATKVEAERENAKITHGKGNRDVGACDEIPIFHLKYGSLFEKLLHADRRTLWNSIPTGICMPLFAGLLYLSAIC